MITRLGALWALAYVPVHVWWALGGSTRPFGITDPGPDWTTANWAATVLIAGAGLLCVSLTHPRGAVVPRAIRVRTAQAAGSLALVHWAVFTVTVTVSGPDVWGWWNLLVFEPWFAGMGVLLLAAARGCPPDAAAVPRYVTALTLSGVVVTVVGVVAFAPWLFLGAGPVLVVAGVLGHTFGRPGSRPSSDAPAPVRTRG